MLRRTRRGFEEISPARCMSCGGEFGPGKVLIGVRHCACMEVRIHREHHCLRCGADTFTPPMGPDCRPQSLDGR